ncbi:LuxR family transcriptional regulator [Pokkaliibacter plantistimulans]|uniref:LuxR family transcriptional regulator n=1 Tax=Pokkaliibacter plantistimulans TaxID=1635171 RepID=UPI000D74FA59|nr:LuxR family transcriptional regulator [Pokkaliibacter plantistimulans]
MESAQLAYQDAMSLLDISVASLAVRSEEDFQSLLQQVKKLLPCVRLTYLQLAREAQGIYPLLLQGLNLKAEETASLLRPDYLQSNKEVGFVLAQRCPIWLEYRDPQCEYSVLGQDNLIGHLNGQTLHNCSILNVDISQHQREEHFRLILSYLLPHLHEAGRRVAAHSDDGVEKVVFSQREAEVLRWLHEGKSSWEIGVILGISERTVKFHVANMCRRLNVCNRMHLVSKAMHMKILH